MNIKKTTLLTNIYNEEYLLPFWLNHHKNMFDDIIVIDYNSTDKSVEICKNICPNCKIIKSRNEYYGAQEIDLEFMDIENNIEGIKIVLNTTEFLFCEKSINELFINDTTATSYAINCTSPYSLKTYDIINSYELFKNLLNDDIKYHTDRFTRQIHTFPNGNYNIGRHSTFNDSIPTTKAHIIWFGYYPMNDNLLKRKLQIQYKIPDSDKYHVLGFGFHHFTDKNKLLTINNDKSNTGTSLQNINLPLYELLSNKYNNKTFIVTGGCGFIGSHMVDKLISLGYKVIVFDNLLSGNIENLNKNAIFENVDITNFNLLKNIIDKYDNIDGIFHFAAIARTQWCIEDPLLCYNTNVIGTINILEIARNKNIKRIVLSSSNGVYAFLTPYRTSKEALEGLALSYNKMYNMSVIALRYSNVYGKRQSELGPSPNVFAALRKSKKELGKLIITGDGTQTRNYTHVSDIVNGNLLSMFNDYCGIIDLCTGKSIPLNYAAKFFECPIEYIDERPGDVKHIIQSPDEAYNILGWKALTELEDGILDVLEPTIGFIILRHVNNDITNTYWVQSYNSIRKYYPENNILIIDDNSNYDFITDEQLYKTTIINSEYPKRGELLPYYYYIHNKLFDIAVIIHDSVFINSYIDFTVEKYKILWDFDHESDNIEDETNMINVFNNLELKQFYENKDLWNGCFGAMSIIRHDYLTHINDKYDISKLLDCILTRYNRQSFERIISCLLQKEAINNKTLLGNIHQYCDWGLTINHIDYCQHLPIIKCWTGR